jgi:flagellar biogenesis protein FliO
MLKFSIKKIIIVSLASLFITVLNENTSFAMSNLKKIMINDQNQVDLVFDRALALHQVKTEFNHDIIQLTISDASVYPAKINTIGGMELTKIFAYQYSPGAIRIRLSMRQDSERYQKKFNVSSNGKMLSLWVPSAPEPLIRDTAERTPSNEKKNNENNLSQSKTIQQDFRDGRDLNDKKIVDKKVIPDEKEQSKDTENGLRRPQQISPWTKIFSNSLIPWFGLLAVFFSILCFVLYFIFKDKSVLKRKAFEENTLAAMPSFQQSSVETIEKKQTVEKEENHYTTSTLKIVSSQRLGDDKMIYLIKSGETMLVLGVTPHQIQTLSQYRDEEQFALQLGAFSDRLKQFEKSQPGAAFGDPLDSQTVFDFQQALASKKTA